MFQFLSVNNIVIAPAKTGNDNNNKKAVINTDQTNNGNFEKVIPRQRILKMVTIKLIAPAIEETPAKCRLKIAESTAAPECDNKLLNGGYTVHPVPAPVSIKLDNSNRQSDGGSNQKEILFSRGKAISAAPNIIGTNQLL